MLAPGIYYIGTGGDYLTWELAFAQLTGAQTGDIELIQISDLTINSSVLWPITDNVGYKITLSSEKVHRGVEANAWKTYVNIAGSAAIRNNRANILEIKNLWFECLINRTGATPIIQGNYAYNNALGKDGDMNIHDNVFNMNNFGDSAIESLGGSVSATKRHVRIWNNFAYGAKSSVAYSVVVSGNIATDLSIVLESNTIRGACSGFSTIDNVSMELRKNVAIDTSGIGTCFDFGNQSDSHNNMSSDATANTAIVESNNIINAVEANEFTSVVPGNADFMKPISTGQAADGGDVSVITDNILGGGGNARPWVDLVLGTSGYSIGFYELPSVPAPPPPPPNTTINAIYQQVQSNLTQISGYLSIYNGGIRALVYSYGGELRVFETNKCFRYAINPEQGKNWSEFGGPGWIWPEANVKGVKVFTDKDQPIIVIMDAVTGLFYRIASKNGPSGSGVTKLFKDKVGAEYAPGESIGWIIRLKEHIGNKEKNLVSHIESHNYLRPENEANQGATGYDENGYLIGQEITVKAYENGKETESAKTENIPYKGDIVFDKKIENNRIQIEISGTESAIKMVGGETAYELKDQRGAPSERIMQEGDFQLEMSEPLHWLTRGYEPTKDFATGNSGSGSIFGLTDGPDAENSAMVFSLSSSLEYENSLTINGDFTFQFAINSILSTTEVVRLSNNGLIRIVVVGDEYFIEYEDNSGTYSQPMTWDGDEWVFVKITRIGATIYFSENGTRLSSQLLGSLEILSGNIQYLTNNQKELFDIRIYDSEISDEAFEYYINDIQNNSGDAFLCY